MLQKKFPINKRHLLLLCLFLMVWHHSSATHVMGGDLGWKCLGKNKYEFTINLYRDCNGCDFGSVACSNPTVKLSTNSVDIINQIKTLSAGADITPVCADQCTKCEGACAFSYGVKKYTIIMTADLDPYIKSGDCYFQLSVSICNRNSSITTGAANQCLYIDGELNACIGNCDNSPIFATDPLAIICVGSPFIFTQGAIDVDVNSSGGKSDSLYFDFTRPLSTASLPTTWNSQYGYNKFIGFQGFPNQTLEFPSGLHINNSSGDILFTPQKIEQTVLAIRVDEYRDGQLIGYIKRDMQLVVIKCPDNTPPIISGIDCSNPFDEKFDIIVCANNTACFKICTEDKDFKDRVKLLWNSSIDKSSFTIIDPLDSFQSAEFCWTPTKGDVSNNPYSFAVIAKDEACPVSGISARTFNVTVKSDEQLKMDTVSVCSTDDSLLLNTLESTYKGGRWYGNGVVGRQKSETDTSKNYYFNIKLTDSSIQFFTVNYDYGNVIPSNYFCSTTDQLVIHVVRVPRVEAGIYPNMCTNNGDLLLDRTQPDTTGMWWLITDTARIPFPKKVHVKSMVPGDYFLHYKYWHGNTGCSDSDSVVLTVNAAPEANFKKLLNRYCIPTAIDLTDSSHLAVGSIQRVTWTINSKEYVQTDSFPTLHHLLWTELERKSFQMTQLVESDQGCFDTARKEILGYHKPIAAFAPDPVISSINLPEILMVYAGSFDDSTAANWWVTDSVFWTEKSNNRITFSDTGVYPIRLTLTKSFRIDSNEVMVCMDSASNPVYITPQAVIFIPSAFSPDGEGVEVNDEFKAIGTYIGDFELLIFNRWGELIWKTNDINMAWDGSHLGNKAPAGVYLYLAKGHDINNVYFEINGTLTLIR